MEAPDFVKRCEKHKNDQRTLTKHEVHQIEVATRGQSSNPEWFQQRKGGM